METPQPPLSPTSASFPNVRTFDRCFQHFIGNEQEHFHQAPEAAGYRFKIAESVSKNMDDVTLHELYFWPFADAIRAGVGSVMCSYNQMNNSYACQNSELLNNVLKDKLGFQGFVMSDVSKFK
jgi:beta-glucosidase